MNRHLTAKEFTQLLEDLKDVASAEVQAERIAMAEKHMAEIWREWSPSPRRKTSPDPAQIVTGKGALIR